MAFSSDFLHLVSTMDRLMDTSGGSALVVARSGSGRKSALKLVAYMRQIDIYTPKMSKNYSVKQFKADLKQVSHIFAAFLGVSVACFGAVQTRFNTINVIQ